VSDTSWAAVAFDLTGLCCRLPPGVLREFPLADLTDKNPAAVVLKLLAGEPMNQKPADPPRIRQQLLH
jgi:hypothetical protein